MGKVVANKRDEMKADKQSSFALFGGIDIIESSDMNQPKFMEVGNYYCVSNEIANSLLHSPFKEAFIMKVDYATGLGYPRQTFIRYSDSCQATRIHDQWKASENKWSEFTYSMNDSMVSNQNILINSNFDVNQREKDVYDVHGTAPRTYDRWSISCPNGESRCRISRGRYGEVNTIIKTITSYQEGWLGNLFQTIESGLDGTSQLGGNSVTFSCLVKTNTDYHCIYIGYLATDGNYVFEVEGIDPNVEFTNYCITRKLPMGISNLQVGIGYSRPQPSDALGHVVEMCKPKFEAGSVQTKYIYPIFSEELEKCKRFYEVILIHSAVRYNSNYLGFTIPCVPKRLQGTIEVKTAYSKVANSVTINTGTDGIKDFKITGGGVSILKSNAFADWNTIILDCILENQPSANSSWFKLIVIIDAEI